MIRSLLCAAAGALMLTHVAIAADPPQGENFKLMESAPATGTNIKRQLVSSYLPFNKRYADLTPEQKARLRAEYDKMPDTDEPPFPKDGLGSVYLKLSRAQERLQSEGALLMHVQIDAEGVAQSVSVIQTPDRDMAQVAAGVMILEKYKPAVCAGQPCAMSFPVRMEFRRRY